MCILNYKTITLFGVLLIYGTPAFTQTPASLQGSVVSETGEKIEFYTLVLRSAADSSVVSVEMFSDTVFRFGGIKPQTYILRIQDVQYQAYDTLITVVEGANVLTVPLVLKPASLGEVVVKASRPVLYSNHGNLTVDVANSYLKDDISLESILGKLPGVIVENGNISMFGKNNLLIYINDREIRSQDELESLQPINIDKIEIIRNVSSEYNANADAVIKIRIKRRKEEKVFISLYERLSLEHYLSNNLNLNLYLAHNEKISQYLTYNNSPLHSRRGGKSYNYTYFDDYTNLSFKDNSGFTKQKLNTFFYSLNYSTGKNSELGVQYNTRFHKGHESQNGIQQIYQNDILNKTVNFNSDVVRKSNSHDISLNYKRQINSTGELSVISDYVINSSHGTEDIDESSFDNWHITNINVRERDSRVVSISPQYRITGRKLNYGWGLKYSSLTSNSVTEYRPSMDVKYSRLSEYTGGVYMTFEADLFFVNIKSGIRMEYTDSKIQYDNGLNNLNKGYLNLFPHISINRKKNEHLNLTVYYRRMIARPSLFTLNSEIIYIDSLTYSAGNPRIKPVFNDNFNLNVTFYKFDFLIGLQLYSNAIMQEYIADSSNPSVTVHTYGNASDKHKILTLGISYSFNHPIFNSMISLNCNKPDLGMPFRNGTMKFDRPVYVFQTSGNIKILKNTGFTYSFYYRSSGNNQNTQYKSSGNLSSGISQYLMDRKLMISLSVSDILEQNKSTEYTRYSNNVSNTTFSLYPDSRRVSFTVRYNWGVNRSIQRKVSDTDHIERL
jgi:hypothetical protein